MPSGTSASRRKLSTRSGWDERPTGVNRMARQNAQHVPKAAGLLLMASLLCLAFRHFSVTSSSAPAFLLADLPLPVHHELPSINFANHPVSQHRPRNQFIGRRLAHQLTVVTIVTATQNPRPSLLLETYESLRQQSLQAFQWIIIDDYTTSSLSKAALEELAKRDDRITLMQNSGVAGLPSARNLGLEHALTMEELSPYIVVLDDDDLFELTALEKVVWMLESNSEWSIGGFPYVKFGVQNVTEWRGLHSGKENYAVGNFIPNAAIMRTSALIDSECWYDEEHFSTGGEDWDMWMCLAAAGHWGGTIPELLYWYRVNDSTFREARWGTLFTSGFQALRTKIQTKHAHLAITGAFPVKPPRRSIQLEPVSWEPPYASNIERTAKSIMFVLPWLYIGGADIGALHMIQLYAEAGYRVTVVCTLYKKPAGLELRPFVLQFTHDVHILPSFLRAHDFPRYIKHLIQSRGIEEVIISNSQYMYEFLPAIADQLPYVKFIDYLHNEAYDGWKSGGYPIYSIFTQRYLARTITCSSYLRDWAVARGHSPSRIGVVKLGIEIADFVPPDETARNAAKKELLGVGPSITVIAIVARLDPQKRPIMVPDIADQLKKMGAQNFIIVMLGDGDLLVPLNNRIDLLGISSLVWPLGTVNEPQNYLRAADIFLLPSLSEGISIAVAEAMAMGLPVVTARAGALPEQLGEIGQPDPTKKMESTQLSGILVNHTLINAVDAKMYAEELYVLLQDEQLRQAYGNRARKNVENTFDWRTTLKGMFREVETAKNLVEAERVGLPHPASYLAAQTLLMEASRETDFAIGYGR